MKSQVTVGALQLRRMPCAVCGATPQPNHPHYLGSLCHPHAYADAEFDAELKVLRLTCHRCGKLIVNLRCHDAELPTLASTCECNVGLEAAYYAGEGVDLRCPGCGLLVATIILAL